MLTFSKHSAALASAILLIGSLWSAGSTIAPAAPADRLETQAGRPRVGLDLAQGYPRPPAAIDGANDTVYGRGQPDSAGLLLRIDRLENQLRQINGDIEQLQFEFRKLSDQLEKFQQDVDFRFQDGGRDSSGERHVPVAPAARSSPKRTDAQDYSVDPNIGTPAVAAETGPTSAAPKARRRGDAFDPAADPGALGAPRRLGSPAGADAQARPTAPTTQTTGPIAGLDPDDPEAPLDLASGKPHQGKTAAAGEQLPTPRTPQPLGTTAAQGTAPTGGTVGAAAPSNSAKEEFDVALDYLKQKEFESAEQSFAKFLQKNPKSKMTSDALYYLGESYYQRGRQREAAEQYLKVSTGFVNSPRAPDALLRLGQSLSALGAKDQACATFAEISRKYPNAPATVRAGAEREARRTQC